MIKSNFKASEAAEVQNFKSGQTMTVYKSSLKSNNSYKEQN